MTKPTVTTKELVVDRMYTYNGINIAIRIDFEKKLISLRDNQTKKNKQWLFCNRGLEYMQGWDDIFSAMRECVKFATIELQQYVDDETLKLAKLADKLEKAS